MDIQQQIRDEQGDKPAADLVRTLPRHSILVEQFRRDQENTLNLLISRRDALLKDTNNFYFPGKARKAIARMDEKIAALQVSKSEDDLVALLDEIKAYEKSFNKDSWIAKATIAFFGVAKFLGSHLGPKLEELVAFNELDDRRLLDPTVVRKDNEGTLYGHNPNGLHNLVELALSSTDHATLNQRQVNTMAQLQRSDFPEEAVIADAEQLITYLTNHHPAVVKELMATEFERMTLSKNPEEQAKGREFLAQLAAVDANPQTLLEFMANANGLDLYLGSEVRAYYLNQLVDGLTTQTDAHLENHTVLGQEELNALKKDYESARALAKQLEAQQALLQLDDIKDAISFISAIPLHKVITSGQYQGSPIWHMTNDLTLQQVSDALTGHDDSELPSAEEKAIRSLNAWMATPAGTDLQGVRNHLKMKDELLTAQQDYALDQAQKNLKDKEKFAAALETARKIEASRPPYQLIADGAGIMKRIMRAGRAALTPDRLPLEHRIRSLMLEQKMVEDGYDFGEEVCQLFMEIPGLVGDFNRATGHAYTNGTALLEAYRDGEVTLPKLLFGLGKVSNEAKNIFAQRFRDTLTGAAAVAQSNPRLLRDLAGNIAQTRNNLWSVLGGNSALVSVYNELHSRVSAEASAQYFIEAMQREDVDLDFDSLSPEHKAAVRRLITINKILTTGKYMPVAIEGIVKTAAGGPTPLNIAWNAATTGVRLFSTYMIGNKVNALDGDNLKIVSAALDVIHDGATAAAYNQQLMEHGAELMANLACQKCDLITAAETTVLYPFKVLFRNVADAWDGIFKKKPGALTRFGVMVLKAAPAIIAPVAMSFGLLTLPVVSVGFASITLIGIPAALWASWSWASHMVKHTGLVDISLLALEKAQELATNSVVDFNPQVERKLQEPAFQQQVQVMAANHSYAGIAAKYWKEWAAKDQERATKLDQDFQRAMDKDREENQEYIQHIKQIASTLRYLRDVGVTTVEPEELIRHLPVDDRGSVPQGDEVHHRYYWALALENRLQAELEEAYGHHEELPADDAEVQARLDQFFMDRMRGMELVAEYAKAQENYQSCVCQTVEQITLRARNRLSAAQAKAMTKGMEVTFASRAAASGDKVGNKMRPDTFAAALKQDQELNQAIRREFTDVFSAEMQKSERIRLSRLKTRLHKVGYKCTDEEVAKLVNAAAPKLGQELNRAIQQESTDESSAEMQKSVRSSLRSSLNQLQMAR